MHDDAVDGALKRIHHSLDRVEQLADGGNRNTAKIEINAGGVALWLASLMAFAMFIMFMMERDDKRDDILELKREMQAIKDDNKGIRAYINGGFVKPKPQERK